MTRNFDRRKFDWILTENFDRANFDRKNRLENVVKKSGQKNCAEKPRKKTAQI